MEKGILLVNLGAALFLTGVIWIVQLLVYPAFAFVRDADFSAFHRRHTSSISPVVGPAMIVELAASGWLALFPPLAGATLARVGFGLALAIWVSTFFVQVPLHDALARGFDADAHRRLVATNWIRTVLWTLRAAIASTSAFVYFG